jgi:hypothetical protein
MLFTVVLFIVMRTSRVDIPDLAECQTAQFRCPHRRKPLNARETFPACPSVLSRSETAGHLFPNIWQERCLRREAAYGKITSGMYG